MATPSLLPFFLLLPVLYFVCTAESTIHTRSSVAPPHGATTSPHGATACTNFIKTSCNATYYPAVCIETLSAHASVIKQNPFQMAKTALSLSLAMAHSTMMYVSMMATLKGLKPGESKAVKDCLAQLHDSVDQLTKSVPELDRMGHERGEYLYWSMGNMEMMAGTALTDETTCVNGFANPVLDGHVKASVKGRVVHLSQVTGVAISLVDRFVKLHFQSPNY